MPLATKVRWKMMAALLLLSAIMVSYLISNSLLGNLAAVLTVQLLSVCNTRPWICMYIVPHKQLECPTRCEDAEFSWSSLHDVYDFDYPFLVWLLPKRYSCLFNPCLFNPCLTFDSLSVSFSFILLYPFLSFDFLFVFFLFLVWISTHVCLLNHFQYLQFLSVFFYPLLHVFILAYLFWILLVSFFPLSVIWILSVFWIPV